jgi:hypothetical protein
MPLPAERLVDEREPESRPTAWASDSRRSERRPSPATLAALAVLAGLTAMALGGLAVFTAARSDDSAAPTSVAPAVSAEPGSAAERRALALLAKPSTERIVFRGSGGRLVLAVGTGGRAALLLRGLE